jgi:hypothetical protein
VWTCIDVPTTIYIQAAGTLWGYLDLWFCGSQNDGGRKSETWLAANCTLKGQNNGYFTVTDAGKNGSKDRVAPPKTQPGAIAQQGWWLACTEWTSDGPNGLSSRHGPDFSNWVSISPS